MKEKDQISNQAIRLQSPSCITHFKGPEKGSDVLPVDPGLYSKDCEDEEEKRGPNEGSQQIMEVHKPK